MPENLVVGVIPARWGSTRFPGKPLHEIAGKPLILHVWDQCQRCRQLSEVVVATDDSRIVDAVEEFGGKAVMTREDHPSGTDRVAEAAEHYPDATHLINIQGDEPLIDPSLIDQLAESLIHSADLPMVTAANPIEADDPAVDDPDVVKVVVDQMGRALYFSRCPIPFRRNREETTGATCYRHKGIYGFRRDFLVEFVSWEPSFLEQTEKLEQLRALENGAQIQVIITKDESPGVDTLEQAGEVGQFLSGNSK